MGFDRHLICLDYFPLKGIETLAECCTVTRKLAIHLRLNSCCCCCCYCCCCCLCCCCCCVVVDVAVVVVVGVVVSVVVVVVECYCFLKIIIDEHLKSANSFLSSPPGE